MIDQRNNLQKAVHMNGFDTADGFIGSSSCLQAVQAANILYMEKDEIKQKTPKQRKQGEFVFSAIFSMSLGILSNHSI